MKMRWKYSGDIGSENRSELITLLWWGVVCFVAAGEADTPELNQLIIPPLHQRIEVIPEWLLLLCAGHWWKAAFRCVLRPATLQRSLEWFVLNSELHLKPFYSMIRPVMTFRHHIIRTEHLWNLAKLFRPLTCGTSSQFEFRRPNLLSRSGLKLFAWIKSWGRWPWNTFY